jgi:hypothetical protein
LHRFLLKEFALDHLHLFFVQEKVGSRRLELKFLSFVLRRCFEIKFRPIGAFFRINYFGVLKPLRVRKRGLADSSYMV